MSLVKVENLTASEIRAKLVADLTKASSAADTMTIYSAYMNTLNELEKANNSQNAQYRTVKNEIMTDAHGHHMENLDLHQNILGLIDSRLRIYKPVTAAQALNGYDTQALNNPYGNWGYDSTSGKHYINLFCKEANGSMYMPNATKIFNMSVVVKDATSTYIATPGAVVIETAESGNITTGSMPYIKLYFSNRADRDKLILPLFSTDELIGEVVYFVADAKFPTSGLGAHWSSKAMEPTHTPSWLADAIGREADP